MGQDLRAALAGSHETIAWTRAEADVTDASSLRARILEAQPDVVVNCAAATNVDRCETEPDWAYRQNGWGAWSAAAATVAAGARLIHLSTDFVFSGETDRPYHEWDATGPLSQYGASKLAGETAVLRSGVRASIVRTQWLYGRNGASFPKAILNAARRRPEGGLKVVADQYGAPTFTGHLARKVARLIDWPVDGIYHVNNAGECSRYDWARELLRQAGLEDVPVTPIAAAEWPAPAPRPARSTLRRYALELMGEDDLPTWQEGLRDYLAELRGAGELD